MNQTKIRKLVQRAQAAFLKQDYLLERTLWQKLVSALPDRPRFKCNLATADMNCGEYVTALNLFNEVIEEDPTLSRAHNNRANLLIRMGVDLQSLLPNFLLALQLSESYDDFIRHGLNVCETIAFGPDKLNPVLFDQARELISQALTTMKGDTEGKQKELAQWNRIVAAYIHVGEYRSALAERMWTTAEKAHKQACRAFEDLGFPKKSEALTRSKETFDACKMVYALLEEIASKRGPTAVEANLRANSIREKLISRAKNNPHDSHRRLIETLGWFLTAFTYQTSFLAGAASSWGDENHVQPLIELASTSYTKIGHELIGILNFINKRCHLAFEQTQRISSPTLIRDLLDSEWAKIALYINGQVFSFQTLEVAFAKEMLGWSTDSQSRARIDIIAFRDFVERQAFRDIMVDGSPRENIGRALLQAQLSSRSYREVAVRGGRSDILIFNRDSSRILIETKIWKGSEYHEAGLRELAEYIRGENDDGNLKGVFYVVFDPTNDSQSIAYQGGAVAVRKIQSLEVEVIAIRLKPPVPSKQKA